MDKLIKEIALRANDVNFEDFDQYVYRKVLLTAKRKVAKRYNLVQRLYRFTSYLDKDTTSDPESPGETEDIILPLTNFISEYEVVVHDVPYQKVDRLTIDSVNEYVLERNHNQILFNYFARTDKEDIRIYYTADINKEDSETEDYEAIIPSQYEEEIISLALTELSKLGVIKFVNTEREKKYSSLLQIYAINERDLDKELLKNDTWVAIKTYKPY